MDTMQDRKVRERAYQLWEADGRPDGSAAEYWHRAENQLRDTDEKSQARAVEDSFPASDPPSTTGITGPGKAKNGKRKAA